MGKKLIQQSAHRYTRKKECESVGCDWTAHVGKYCGKCKKILQEMSLLKEAEKRKIRGRLTG